MSRHRQDRDHYAARDLDLTRDGLPEASTSATTRRLAPTAPLTRGEPRPTNEPQQKYKIRIEHIEHRDYVVRAASSPAAIQQLLAAGLRQAWQHASDIQPDQFKIVHDTDE